jgi:hypothetical protein
VCCITQLYVRKMCRQKTSLNSFKRFISTKTRSLDNGTLIITYANTMEFIHMNVHIWLVINLYIIISLILVHSSF